MISIDDAFRHYQETLEPLPAETRPLRRARSRVLARPVRSPVDLPPFRQSAMDGYALRAEDVREASREAPARLPLAGTSPAGPAEGASRLRPGQAVRIFTGGPVPDGADAVLRQEDARVEDGVLRVDRPVEEGASVRDRGEELARGTQVADAGTRLSAGHVGALAAVGVDRVEVRRAPRVALFVTGDEVADRGGPLEPGEVYDANTPLVEGWLAVRGVEQVTAGRLRDEPDATRRALDGALEEADLVLTTGGVSVGDRDFVLEAAKEAGAGEVFWRVRQKPGKPLFFGLRDGTPLLGLPGNPGSVHACLVTHVRRVLDLLEGGSEPGPPLRPGRLSEPFSLNADREWWARCRLRLEEGDVWLDPLERQASHMITDLGRCDAVARLPRGEGRLEAGAEVLWAPAAGPGLTG